MMIIIIIIPLHTHVKQYYVMLILPTKVLPTKVTPAKSENNACKSKSGVLRGSISVYIYIYIYVYTHIFISLSLSLSLYMNIYISQYLNYIQHMRL